MRAKIILLIIIAVSLIMNGVLAYRVFNTRDTQDTQKSLQEQYPYLSKRIFASNPNDIVINFIPLRQALKEYVEMQDGKVGVYFEYLPSGTSIGVNEQMEIKLVSLVKIPVVMAVYKKIEGGEINRDEVLTLRQEDLDTKYGDAWKMGAGAKLPLTEAVNLALIESDNTATNALIFRVGLKAIQDVFDGLDIPRDTDAENILIISPKNYSSIFRSLYLSSYLREESSNEVLDILTKTIFKDKLPAGVPPSVKVAHKIGVFDLKNIPDKTYSDCGIIYVPERPYILCIITKSTEDKAREYMQYLSKMVYGYIIRVKGGQ